MSNAQKVRLESQLDLFGSGDIAVLAGISPGMELQSPTSSGETWSKDDAAELNSNKRSRSMQIEPRPQYISHSLFKMTKDGLTIEATRGKGKARKTAHEAVSGPFEILGRSRNDVGSGWGLWLQWRDSDHRTHQRLVPAASLHGETGVLCQALASEGLFIERDKQKELARYLNSAHVARRVTVVDHSGWHVIGGRQVFVLPNETIGGPESETVMLESAANAPYQSRGSLDDWRAGVATLTRGHSLPVLAISTALAGPLVNLVGGEGGGLHFFGASSRGKTTMLQAAASVWGRGGTPGFVRAWRATTNGLEGAAALASDTVLILDEMGVLEARDAAAAIYGLANGAGKQRASRDGSLSEPKSWRVIVISSGEIPLEAKLTEGKGKARAGQLIRILDVPATGASDLAYSTTVGHSATPANYRERSRVLPSRTTERPGLRSFVT